MTDQTQREAIEKAFIEWCDETLLDPPSLKAAFEAGVEFGISLERDRARVLVEALELDSQCNEEIVQGLFGTELIHNFKTCRKCLALAKYRGET